MKSSGRMKGFNFRTLCKKNPFSGKRKKMFQHGGSTVGKPEIVRVLDAVAPTPPLSLIQLCYQHRLPVGGRKTTDTIRGFG
jgi:hypothetical protein